MMEHLLRKIVPNESPFPDLIRRVRHGDQAAAAELVRRYEPAIRRAVRFRLAQAPPGAPFDSTDVCQSVLLSFFVRTAAGEYDLESPDQLLHLLLQMAHNKLVSLQRRERAACRDAAKVEVQRAHDTELVDPASPPAEQVAAAELLQKVYQCLSPEERTLVELRNRGLDWSAIAARLGETAVVLRKRLSRALDRVTRRFGLEAPADD